MQKDFKKKIKIRNDYKYEFKLMTNKGILWRLWSFTMLDNMLFLLGFLMVIFHVQLRIYMLYILYKNRPKKEKRIKKKKIAKQDA